MSLTRFAIRYDRLTLVLLAVVLVAGISTFRAMPRAYDPGFIIRAAQVVTLFPGASPERVERLVSSKVEDAVKEIPELDYVTSESRTGISIVTVNIKESYTAMRPVWDDLRRKIDDLAPELPDGVIGPNVNDEFGDVFGIVMTITGDGFSYAELDDVAEEVQDALLRLPDAAKIERLGAQDERVFIAYDNARLAELGISPAQLSQALASRNIVISGGSFNLGDERIALEPSGNFESLDDIRRTVLTFPGTSQLLYLEDIARISRGYVDPPERLVHASGEPALALGVSMREGGNNIALGAQVEEALAKFQAIYPYGIEFDLVSFSPAEVEKKVSDFVVNLGQAVVVVTLVMLVSLGLRAGLVVAVLIPVSILLALIVMSVLGIGLDQISLAALIIALGMLVDNGIVMSENIMVQMQQGKDAIAAAVDSAAELRIPLLTASLTTAAAFLPIYLAESNVGEFTASLFKVVTITLLCSWLVSLTLVPLLCVRFLRIAPLAGGSDSALGARYRAVLELLLRHRVVTLLATALLFSVAVAASGLVPKEFFPPSDRSYFKVELEMPGGTSIEAMERVVTDVESFIAARLIATDGQPGVVNWVSYIGFAGPRFVLSHNPRPATPDYALMVVNVSSAAAIPAVMERLQVALREVHPDLEAKLRLMENGPAVDNPVEVRLSGTDDDRLFAAVENLKEELRRLGGVRNIDDDWGQRIKKLAIRIDQPRARRSGVSSEDIAISLQAGLSGLELTEYREGEDVIPVILRSTGADSGAVGKVQSLSVYAQASGQSVPLAQVADVELVWDIATVYRRNGLRTVTVGAQLEGGVTAADRFAALLPWLEQHQQAWGPAVRFELGGESESSGKANASIAAQLPLAGFIIATLLVGQFNSVRKALIVLATIPLGLIGVIGGLLAARSFFGFMTLLGIVSLAGIVINNAIVLLERIQIERDAGLDHHAAIVTAALQRARPILLTTVTTVLGLMPLYLSGGELWETMAIAIMAGLVFSTLMTLGVIPVLYATLFGVKVGTE